MAKFDYGDRVLFMGAPCTVVDIDRRFDAYHLIGDDGIDYFVLEKLLKFENPKLIFLHKLQELLREFDAEIVAHIGEDNLTYKDKPLLYIQLGSEVLNYEQNTVCCEITPENVFHFQR